MELALISGTTAKIIYIEDAEHKFLKAKTIPYGLRDRVNKEIDRLEKAGITKPVEFSDCAALIVPDGSVRLSGDYKVTVNRVAKVEK